MNILFVVPYYAPAFSYGGVVSSTVAQAETLVEMGNRVIVITTNVLDNNSTNKIKYEIINGVEIFRFKNLSNFAAKHLNFYNGFGIKKFLDESSFRIDIIHIADIFSFMIINPVLNYAIINEIPYLIQPHGLLITQYLRYNLLLFALKNLILKKYRNFFRNTKAVISVSHLETKYLFNYFPKEKIYEIPNGIKINRNTDAISFNHTLKNPNQFTIVSLGRLSFVKGYDRAIKSIAELYKLNKNIKYHIYGPSEKNYYNRLNLLINHLNAGEYIKLMGPVYNEDKYRALMRSDIFLIPSRSEAQGIVVLEALNSGLPCIISNEAYLSEYEKYDCCIKVDIDNTQEFAGNLNNLIPDKGRLTKMKNDTFRLLEEKFDNYKNINELYKVYQKIGKTWA